MGVDAIYANLIADVLASGEEITTGTRNGSVCRLIGKQVVFTDTPLVSLRKTAWRTALREWEWFMSGSNDINDAHPSVRPWWEPWANDSGRVANNYSQQFRSAQGGIGVGDTEVDVRVMPVELDQIAFVLDAIKNHPFSRRNLLTTWNAAEMAHPSTPITNCHHSLTQFFVDLENRLHMVTYQRSVDVIVGLPANWIQTWAFLMWLAHHGGREVGSLKWIGGDIHIYEVHVDVARRMVDAKQQLSPRLVYTPSGGDFRADDFTLDGPYTPAIVERAAMVV